MTHRRRPPMRHPVPLLSRAGMAVVATGLLLDLTEHSVATAADVATQTPGQHAAHLIVVIGMVLVLVGVVRDGVSGTGRNDRLEGSSTHAVR